ncbi:PREDICTED: uncharacterized protein LOC109163774 [Ipomoea nil]|uniref:uncharacterized protein LOC109163774 n=1 Tax=Ipomoea nil TaxID=35883 RepID=UPI0009010145|nr:PREDICTED: uncharacterized protein LOC109163774 [Ipomoea nil]
MKDILKRAGMVDCKPVITHVSSAKITDDVVVPYDDPTQYRSLAAALQYLTVTRPDLSYAVNLLCQHMHVPTTTDWASLMRVSCNLISWVCRKQRTVSRSSTEAEYKGVADVSAEVTWLVSLLHEIGIPPASPPRLWCKMVSSESQENEIRKQNQRT